jgi:MFS family permease
VTIGQKQESTSETKSKSGRFSYPWLIFAISFIALIVYWGSWRSFGVFLKPMAQEFGWSRAETTGPTILFFIMSGIAGIFLGKLIDKYGPRIVIPAFGIVFSAGFALMSQINSLWQFYISLGLLAGTGLAVAYIPFVSTVSLWFEKRRGTILGILVAGIGVGYMIIPPLIQMLVLNSGWRTAYLVLGISILLISIIAGILVKRPPGYKAVAQSGKDININSTSLKEPDKYVLPFRAILKYPAFWMLSYSYFTLTLSLEMFGAHIVAYATDQMIAPTIAAIMISALGIASIAGKISSGVISDRTGRKLVLASASVLLGLSLIFLPFARTVPIFFVCTALFGFAYGAYAPMIPAIIGDLFGVASMGSIMGLVLFVAAIGSSIGPVLGGYIFDVSGQYDLAFWIAAALSLSGALIVSRIKTSRFKK